MSFPGAASAEIVLKRNYDRALNFWRANSPAGRTLARKRAATEALLDDIARASDLAFDGTVLIDATFDNPNYWLRFSLLRAALGLARGREIGILGEYRRSFCRGTLRNFGISAFESYPDIEIPAETGRQADALIAQTASAEDILAWKLPDGIDPAILYDGILKRQRLASVDIHDPSFARLVHEAMVAIERGRHILDKHKPDLLVVAHPFNFSIGTLAWQALVRGIEAVLPFGLFGGFRFTRFFAPRDLTRFYDRPSRAEIDGLSSERAEAMAAIGRRYMAGRLRGAAGDLASQFAFQKNRGQVDRREICAKFGWDPAKLIVGFYASNWYDWPHQLGMTQFRDFLDWTEASVKAANANRNVNWLFKPHPAEEWFGGVGLADVFKQFQVETHVGLTENGWSSASVMQSLDALVTYHGTAGIEFAAQGKPVLVPDRGKYDDCGFVVVAKDRADYLEKLACDWWRDWDLAQARRRAEIFAGWWFCLPDWQNNFLIEEDSLQDKLYDRMPDLVRSNSAAIERELSELRAWWRTGHLYYHTTKMANADRYVISNLAEPKEEVAVS